jgi:hypothetical protein
MADSSDVLIGDAAGSHVLIRPLMRSHPGLFDSSDGNWIECDVEIAAGAFRATFPAHLQSEEFHSFLEEVQDLDRTRDGTATFTTVEGQIALTISGGTQSRFRLSGEAIDDAEAGNRLQFKFDVEPADLSQISRSLEHLLTAFPIIVRRDA